MAIILYSKAVKTSLKSMPIPKGKVRWQVIFDLPAKTIPTTQAMPDGTLVIYWDKGGELPGAVFHNLDTIFYTLSFDTGFDESFR